MKKGKITLFYADGDLNVYRDGTVQNMSQNNLKRGPGSPAGDYFHVSTRGKTKYVHRLNAEGHCPRLHRSFTLIDHVHGKSNHYRNLRFSNPVLNAINNISLGVHFNGHSWVARFRGKHLGSFKNSRKAILAVQQAKRTAHAVEFERVTGYPSKDTRMSFESPPFASSPRRTPNDLKHLHENVEVGPFANLKLMCR